MYIIKKVALAFIFAFFFSFNSLSGQNLKNTENIFGVDLSNIVVKDSKISLLSCDTIFSFKTRHCPSGLTWDGINFWYVDSAYIHKVNSIGVHLDSIANPSPIQDTVGGGLAFDGVSLWYADEQSAQLFKINPLTGIVLQQFNLPSFGQTDPNGFGLTWDGTNLWHSQYQPFKLYKIDPTTGTSTMTYSTPRGLVDIDYINGKLFGMSVGKIFKIDPTAGIFIDSASWCIPFSLGLTWDGLYLWNVSGENNVLGIPTGGQQKVYKINSDFFLTINENIKDKYNIKAYPNPSNGIVTIEYSLLAGEMGVVNVYDVTGKLLFVYNLHSGKTSQILDKEIEAGVYLYDVFINNRKVHSDKLVVIK